LICLDDLLELFSLAYLTSLVDIGLKGVVAADALFDGESLIIVFLEGHLRPLLLLEQVPAHGTDGVYLIFFSLSL
jgi:hypothetical protein